MKESGKLIGLIGGVGPWASLDVHRKILEQAAFTKEQDCVSVMHLSFPGKYSDRTEYILGKTNENPAYAFVNELRMLETQGAGCAAIICNTAHAAPILNVIQEELGESSLQYVNIIHETQRAVEQNNHRRVGLLATLGTYELDLYRHNFSGTMVYPSKKNQERVHNLIYNVNYGLKTALQKDHSFLYNELTDVASALLDDGAEALILGCTELPLLCDFAQRIPVPVYDPNQLLASALLRSVGQPAAVATSQILTKQYT
jgi:aspartate racemase